MSILRTFQALNLIIGITGKIYPNVISTMEMERLKSRKAFIPIFFLPFKLYSFDLEYSGVRINGIFFHEERN